jgi:hypothetical protein
MIAGQGAPERMCSQRVRSQRVRRIKFEEYSMESASNPEWKSAASYEIRRPCLW